MITTGAMASERNNTYLSLTSLTTTDVSGNNIFAIPLNMSYQAREVVPDSAGP